MTDNYAYAEDFLAMPIMFNFKSNGKYTCIKKNDKIEICKLFRQSKSNCIEFSSSYGINPRNLRNWLKKYSL